MSDVETRNETRDSLFLLAQIRVEDGCEAHRVRVRNLSDGGMMGEGACQVRRGDRVRIELRDINGLGGTVAWVQGQRFGVAFDEEIDASKARRPVTMRRSEGGDAQPISHAHRPPPALGSGPLRKV